MEVEILSLTHSHTPLSLPSLVGIGEIALLPLDVLKIKMQTNPQLLEGRGLVQLVKDEGRGLYRGATWTAARNAPGSFALFGGSAFAKEYIFGLEDYNKATFFQNFVASITGAIASITVSAPVCFVVVANVFHVVLSVLLKYPVFFKKKPPL